MSLKEIKTDFNRLADAKQAQNLQRYFKTGKGHYGEGDEFLGIKVPLLRQLVRKYQDLPLADVIKLLQSRYHEQRLTALLLLVKKFEKGDALLRTKIYHIYLKSYRRINNWDLVDLSAPNIVGTFLLHKNRKILYQWVKSPNLWKRRIAVISSFAFIRNNDFKDCLNLAQLLLKDEHDLIHKAVGWMLREIGKRNQSVLEEFLSKYAPLMPRTMLRYSIEKFPPGKRKKYLNFKPAT